MSANKLQLKRGTTANVNSYLPLQGEPVLDLTTMSLKIGDGSTLGGVPLSLVASAIKLASPRSFTFTGDATGFYIFDGTANISTPLSLSNTGVAAGSYARVQVDVKGRVTGGDTVLPISSGGTGFNTAAAGLFALGGAPIASPTFSGVPAAPTAPLGTSTGQLATTAFTYSALSSYGLGGTPIGFIGLTLQNSWAVIASRRAVYRKVLDMLQLEVQITGGTSTDGTVLATLPVNFRPAFQVAIPVASGVNTTPAASVIGSRVLINTDGTITCQNCSSTISFSAMLPLT